MNNAALKALFAQYSASLKAAGWTEVLTVSHADGGLAYGTLFTKDGARFYMNKDTVSPVMSGPEMAQACAPLFAR